MEACSFIIAVWYAFNASSFCREAYLEKSFSKTWQYYIWLVVAARLLLPVTAPLNLVGGLMQPVGKLQMQAETGEKGRYGLQEADDGGVRESVFAAPGGNNIPAAEGDIPSFMRQSPGAAWLRTSVPGILISVIWLATAVILLHADCGSGGSSAAACTLAGFLWKIHSYWKAWKDRRRSWGSPGRCRFTVTRASLHQCWQAYGNPALCFRRQTHRGQH